MILFFENFGFGVDIKMGQKGVKSLQFVNERKSSYRLVPQAVKKWLQDYFEGSTHPFPWEYLDLSEATSFEKKVWRQLHRIPFGKVASYQEVAQKIGSPKGSQAVGQANSRNPIPLLIPCHRVISADGTLGGYSCGLELKKKLLKHEGARFYL